MSDAFIPFADPHAAYVQRAEAIHAALRRVLDSGWYILGQEVEAFEREFSAWLGRDVGHMPCPAPCAGMGGENAPPVPPVPAVASAASCPSAPSASPPHVLGVANGTDALELALRGFFALHPERLRPAAAPRGHAAEGAARAAVFTVSHTAVATVSAIERAGAVPVLVDIDPHTLTMDPAALAQAVALARDAGLAPVAVIPVHIYGHPCHMERLAAVAREAGLWVLEDCAQAHGARFRGRLAGTLADAAAFSCYPTKNLGALGDAGAVATADAALAEEMAALRQYGWKERYISALPGINSRLDPVQAAILRINLQHLDADLARRRHIAAQYTAALNGHPLIGPPHTAEWAEPAWHLYVARVPSPAGSPRPTARRDALLAHLRERGIGAALHYPQAVHQQPAYARRLLTAPHGLPVTTALYQEILTLPLYPQMDEAQTQRVMDGVRGWRA